jgi:HlyD family secretion protein
MASVPPARQAPAHAGADPPPQTAAPPPAPPVLPAPAPDAAIAHTLGIDADGSRRRRRLRWLALGAVAVLLAAGLGAWSLQRGATGTAYRTAPVERRTLVVKVSATGTLQPVNQVEVGSELSGVVRTVRADYNDRVRAGQVLAELDADKLRAQVLQAEAALLSARARVQQAEATVHETREQLERVRSLVASNISTPQDLIAAEARFARAQAEEAVARADVSRAAAALNADRINLSKSVITAPIDGIVLVRNVEPGQTVAAVFQAPVLFLLAENLARMELLVDVDEADVGKVRAGQPATFTVDAHPERSFQAQVQQVRFASQTVAGVVTYKALLEVDNAELLLRPGMTATASITVQTVPDALLVPNAALRFTPPAAQDAAASRSWLGRLVPRPPSQPPPAAKAGPVPTVWSLRDEQPVAIPVRVGATDGLFSEIVEGDLQAGQVLLVDLAGSGT